MLSVPSLLLEPENDLLCLHPIKDIIRFFRFRYRHDLIRHESVICGVISTHHSLREDRGAGRTLANATSSSRAPEPRGTLP